MVVVGGSASNVGKTTLAARLIRENANRGVSVVATKVSVREAPCETRVLILRPSDPTDHRRDSGKLLDAGAVCVVWVTVNRGAVRQGLALGLAAARRLRPATIVIESTSAGIELHRIAHSWFVAGDGEWKPWAKHHQARADHIVRSDELFDPPGAADHAMIG